MTDVDAPAQERDQTSLPATEPRKRSRSWRLWTAVVLVPLGCAMLISAFVVQPYLIPSHSMESTLQVGDRIVVNKLAYRFGSEPSRGELVVFDGSGTFAPAGDDGNAAVRLLRSVGSKVGITQTNGNHYIKRVIGVGGDRVTCCGPDGRLMVNGEPLHEPYIHEGDAPSEVTFDIQVPEGRVWLLGDHRANSADSRNYLGAPGGGSVAVGQVIGRAEFIGWPVSRWGSLRDTHG